MYQVTIERRHYDEPVDMEAVITSCADLMTEDQVLGDGRLAREVDSIYVQFGAVDRAAERINALGYQTDEDEHVPDEDDRF